MTTSEANNVVHRFVAADRFGALNLGHDLGIAAGVTRRAASIVQVFTGTRKRPP